MPQIIAINVTTIFDKNIAALQLFCVMNKVTVYFEMNLCIYGDFQS